MNAKTYIVETRPLRVLRDVRDEGELEPFWISGCRTESAARFPTIEAAREALIDYGLELCDSPRILEERPLKENAGVYFTIAR